MSIRAILLVGLGLVAAFLIVSWTLLARRRGGFALPKPIEFGIGFVTDFLDTLGVGSFAVTTSFFKLFKLVPDEKIPGTLNVGHTLPTIAEALIFIAIIGVAPLTLVSLIVASVLGAWFGAGIVARWPRRYVQIGMGSLLLAAGAMFLINIIKCHSGQGYCGGNALALSGPQLAIGLLALFALGALMTIGIGLYAPAMIVVGLLGMNPLAAWPIMMGSCAFLMPFASVRFIKFDAYSLRTAIGLTIGGVPGVLVAAYFVKTLPIMVVRYLVLAVVCYAAVVMLRSAARRAEPEPGGRPDLATP